jgi:hypothetical protein
LGYSNKASLKRLIQVGKGEKMKLILQSFMVLSLVIILNACAFDVLRLKQIPVELQMGSVCMEKFTLTKDTKINVGPGYSRILKSGTRWECVGEIPQGKVYKTKDQILTVEASNPESRLKRTLFGNHSQVLQEQSVSGY